jgi:hypothetical protein
MELILNFALGSGDVGIQQSNEGSTKFLDCSLKFIGAPFIRVVKICPNDNAELEE